MEPVSLILTTVGSEEQGVQIAEHLVEKGLAACVNIVKRIRSIYRWKGEIWDDEEYLLIIKTQTGLFDQVRDEIRRVHTYELPEILCVPVSGADEKVRDWILSSTVLKEPPTA